VIPDRGKRFFSTASRPVLGPTQAPIKWGLGALSPGIKRQGFEADHSAPSNAQVKNGGAITSLLTLSWHAAQLSEHGDNFIFYHNIVCRHSLQRRW
jgi:hypothetical protein